MTLPVRAEQHAGSLPGTDIPFHHVVIHADPTAVDVVVSADAITLTLTPDAARHLAVQLDEAALPAATCRYCGCAIEKPSQLTDLCGICQDREDQK